MADRHSWGGAVPAPRMWDVAGAEDGPKFDHVVSVMFENRTFDNLLGRLYQPGEVGSFEGVIGRELGNPIPPWAEHGADREMVPYGVAASMDAPNPDPGEEFTHVNTQLFGRIDPPGNRGVMSEQMTATGRQANDYMNDRTSRIYPGLVTHPA
jgi:phospholipase C